MFKKNLLSHVDLKSMINATNPDNITDKEHIDAVLNLLITENTPQILSDEALALKIKNLKYDESMTPEERAMIQKPLFELAQLPTGKKLLSMLPDGVTFKLEELNLKTHGVTHYHLDGTASIAINKKSVIWNYPPQLCGTLAHELRHLLQFKYDPIQSDRDYPFTYDNKFYTLDKVHELDAKFLTQAIGEEWLEKFKDDLSTEYQLQKKAFSSHNPDYFQYRDYLGKENQDTPETKEKIANTLYAIDTWYGVTYPDWRQTYHEQAKGYNGFSLLTSFLFGFEESATVSPELENHVFQSYVDNMKIGLPVEFFDENKDCSVVVNGHKLFERKIEKYGRATITMFHANGNPSYQAKLAKNILSPNMQWQKEHETYFYEDGLKKAEYEFKKTILPMWHYPYRCGSYTHYYDSVSSKTGNQHIRERGKYVSTRKGGFGTGIVYDDTDQQQQIEKRSYLDTGELAKQTFLTGENQGLLLNFYTTGQICTRHKIDQNGNGFYEKYRCDAANTLELIISGQIKNNRLCGPYKKFDEHGHVVEEGIADDGKFIPSPHAELTSTLFSNLLKKPPQLTPCTAAAISKQQKDNY